jgi:hypothetical protein
MQAKKWSLICVAVPLGCIILLLITTFLAEFIGMSRVVVTWAVWEYGTPGLILALVLTVSLAHIKNKE